MTASPDTLTREDTQHQTGTDPAKVAHYVRKQRIPDAVIEGTAVEALCGYVFVPSRDPNLPVCPACKAVYDDPEAIHYARWGSE